MSSICERPRSRGFFDGSLEELARSQDEHGYDERPAAAEEFVDDVLVNRVFDVVVDMKSD